MVKIDQRVILSGAKAKRGVLNDLLGDPAEGMERVIVFARTKHGADRVNKNLDLDGHKAAAIHGNKSQNARQAALKGFASGAVRILVATDIAARGIDVPASRMWSTTTCPTIRKTMCTASAGRAAMVPPASPSRCADGTERDKLRDVEKLIRKTLPLSGDPQLLAEATASRPARTGVPQGRPGPRSARNPRNEIASRRTSVASSSTEAGKGGESRSAPRPQGAKPAAAAKKPRWNRPRREAGKSRGAANA